MTISLSVLGSGSRGNCTLLALGEHDDARYILIDCGLSPRQTKLRLAARGVPLERITAILVTHVDSDHFNPGWCKPIRGHDMAVHVHLAHRARAVNAGLDGRHLELFDGPFSPDSGIAVDIARLPHDELGTVGFVIEHEGVRLGFATDLGTVPDSLHDCFVDLDALAIESNYDRDLELASSRPSFLKQRVMGNSGHLSNDQSIDAVLRIAERSMLSHVVLLHLSQQCNHPRLVTETYERHAPELLERLTISEQDRPTPMLTIPRVGERSRSRAAGDGEQIAMFGEGP